MRGPIDPETGQRDYGRLKRLKAAGSKKRLREPVNAKRAFDKERAGVSEQDLRRLTR